MAKTLTDRGVSFLILAVFLVLVSNALITFVAITKVSNEKKYFQLTEGFFRVAIQEGVSNYLNSVAYNVSTNTSSVSDRPRCRVSYLDDFVVYYRPYTRRWQARYQGSDFVVGDYFEDGFIIRISQGKVYVQADDNVISIYRPKVPGSGPLGPDRAPSADIERL